MSALGVVKVSRAFDQSAIPRFHGARLAKVHAVIDWVHARVRKTTWDADRLRQQYARRRLEEILRDGDTAAIAPCPDRTAVAAAALWCNGVPFEVVLHERQVLGYGLPSIHLAIEIEESEEEGPHWFDFYPYETRFFKGSYTFHARVFETLQLRRFKGDDFDPFALTLGEVFELVALRRADRSAAVDQLSKEQQGVTPSMLVDRMTYDIDDSVSSAHAARIAKKNGVIINKKGMITDGVSI